MEVVNDHRGDTFRAVYTRRDIELIMQRLREAEEMAKSREP